MTTSRIKTSHAYDEPTPKYVFADRDWVFANRAALLEKYGECYVIAHDEQVLGTGDTYHEAIENAERNLPADSDQVEAMVIWIGQRLRISRVLRPTKP